MAKKKNNRHKRPTVRVLEWHGDKTYKEYSSEPRQRGGWGKEMDDDAKAKKHIKAVMRLLKRRHEAKYGPEWRKEHAIAMVTARWKKYREKKQRELLEGKEEK